MPENLSQASFEWSTRPDDERFSNLADLYLHTLFAANRAKENVVPTNQLRVVATEDGDINLSHPGGESRFSNWSFGQLARKVGAPLDWLRKVPAELAVENLNYGLENADPKDGTQIWYDNDKVRAATGVGYTRILNHEVVKAVIDLGDQWVTPPARPARPGQKGTRVATEADCYGSNHPDLAVKPGDLIADAGIYGSDRNIFIFRINPTIRLEDGSDGGLGRGFFVRNSEVGDAYFELVSFFYRFICGNHIVWGAEDVQEIKIKHVGRAKARAFDSLRDDLDELTKIDLKAESDKLAIAKREIWPTKQALIDDIFGERKLLGKRNTESAYLIGEKYRDIDGSPLSPYGIANAITRLSQTARYADERTEMDRAAGQILASV